MKPTGKPKRKTQKKLQGTLNSIKTFKTSIKSQTKLKRRKTNTSTKKIKELKDKPTQYQRRLQIKNTIA